MEAVSLGIPIIYTKHTWLETVAEKYGAGIGIENENVSALSNAFVEMYRNFSYYKKAQEN